VRADHDGFQAGSLFLGDDVGDRPAIGRVGLPRRRVAGGAEFGLNILRGPLQRIAVPEMPLTDVDRQTANVAAEILR